MYLLYINLISYRVANVNKLKIYSPSSYKLAPATLKLMQGMKLTPGPPGWTGELVTPTGASLIRVLCGMESLSRSVSNSFDDCHRISTLRASAPSSRQGVLPPYGFVLSAIGVGAGTKEFKGHPNILRIMVGDITFSPGSDGPSIVVSLKKSNDFSIRDGSELVDSKNENMLKTNQITEKSTKLFCGSEDEDHDWIETDMLILQANIDDMTGELGGHLIDTLLTAGT